MKFSRIISITLSLIILLTMFSCMSGCGKNGKKTGDSSLDLGGRTIVIGNPTDPSPDKSSSTYAEETEFIASLEEKYNCKIEWYYTGNWHTYHQEILTKALAGGKIADFFWATGVDIFPKWALNDLIVPLDDYFDFTDTVWNQDYHDFVSYNGQHYGISSWLPAIGEVILFNKRLCASYGVSDKELYDLQRAGNWTWDEFINYAKKFTKVGSSEDNSTYGFAPNGLLSATYHIYSNGDVPVIRNGNSYTYNLNSAKSVEAIQFCYDLFHKHKVTPSVLDSSSGGNLFKKGKVAFFQTAMWSFPEYAEAMKEDELGVLLLPKGPQSADYVNVTDTPMYLFMQPQVEDKEILAKLATELYTPQSWSELYEGYDPASDYKDYYFDDESAETLRMITDKTVVECGAVSTEFRNKILWSDYGINSSTDPRTWADSTQATGQYYLDFVWSQEFTSTDDTE